jgi:hypothetical protein
MKEDPFYSYAKVAIPKSVHYAVVVELCPHLSICAQSNEFIEGAVRAYSGLSGQVSDLPFEKFSAIFGRTGSVQLTKDPRKMLLSFESASHCDIQYAQFRLAQDLFRALGSAAQYKLVGAPPRLTCETFRKNELHSAPRIAPYR